MEKNILKIGIVMSAFIGGVFSFFISDTLNYLSVLTDDADDKVQSGIWGFVSLQFFILSIVLALVFIIKSRKR
jgi:hypothetical protein